MASRYHYQPLSTTRSTRIFTVLPSCNSNAPIQGVISEIDLDLNPSFEALSYVWGRRDPSSGISILTQASDGAKETSSLSVTPNCSSALRALRFRPRARKLWIDAICINQDSLEERNQQVPLMARIYESAENVLVWLNPGDEGKDRVRQTARVLRLAGWLYQMRLLRLYEKDEQSSHRMPRDSKLIRACERYVDSQNKKLGGASNSELRYMFPILISGDFLTEQLDSFNAPFLNQYFQRVWTVQEIAMAHRVQVHYGSQIISWRDFVASGLFAVKRGGFARYQEAVTDVFLHSELHWNLINSLESHFVLPDIFGVEALSNKRSKENILNRYTPGTAELALIKSKGLSATEPKDKSYAMLWVFPELTENTAPLRNVDYRKPIELIYTEYTMALFVKMNGSSFPFYWVNSRPRNASLPSWVPDWKEQTSMSFFIWGGKLRDFRAAKEDSLRHRIEIDGELLRISGVECSNVKGTIRPSEVVRYRDLQHAGPSEFLEGLIDVTELMNGLIDVCRSYTSIPEEELLGVIHRVVHSQKCVLDPGPADFAEYLAKLKEATIAEALNISVGLLRIRVFDKLRFLYDETTILEHETKTALASFLLEHETEVVLQGARELPNLPPFFAVICAVAQYIDVYRFLSIVLVDHRYKDFFITSDDRLGVVFQGLKSGDLVTILQGCPSPMIVRKSEIERRIIYQLHGPAYVDGIMQGEAWSEDENDLQVFELV